MYRKNTSYGFISKSGCRYTHAFVILKMARLCITKTSFQITITLTLFLIYISLNAKEIDRLMEHHFVFMKKKIIRILVDLYSQFNWS